MSFLLGIEQTNWWRCRFQGKKRDSPLSRSKQIADSWNKTQLVFFLPFQQGDIDKGVEDDILPPSLKKGSNVYWVKPGQFILAPRVSGGS